MLHPLPSLVVLGGLLLLAAAWDVTRRRIPNWVNAALGATGLLAQLFNQGALAAASGLGALVLVLALLWKPWTAGMLGGGDVKTAACAAIWMGLGMTPKYLLYSAVASGVVALICFFRSSAAVRREIRSNMMFAVASRMAPPAPMRGGGGRVSVPFGAAMAAGAFIVAVVG